MGFVSILLPRSKAGGTQGHSQIPLSPSKPLQGLAPAEGLRNSVVLGQCTANQGFCRLSGVLYVHVVAPGALKRLFPHKVLLTYSLAVTCFFQTNPCPRITSHSFSLHGESGKSNGKQAKASVKESALYRVSLWAGARAAPRAPEGGPGICSCHTQQRVRFWDSGWKGQQFCLILTLIHLTKNGPLLLYQICMSVST